MMETALLIIGFIMLCGAGIAWDYYKPSRFRTNYATVDTRKTSDAGTSSQGDDCGGGGGD